MDFLLDENVPVAVRHVLELAGHDIFSVTEIIPAGSPDQLVATVAVQQGRILVRHDKDMRRIERYISEGYNAQFPTLSRLMLTCNEPIAADRVEAFLPIVIAEADRVVDDEDKRLLIEIGNKRVRICR